MARMKFPGINKSRSMPTNKKKFNMLGWKRNKKAIEKKEGSVVKPVLISLRKYREIFGDSDEEVLHFTLLSCLLQSFGNLAGISYVIILFFSLCRK